MFFLLNNFPLIHLSFHNNRKCYDVENKQIVKKSLQKKRNKKIFLLGQHGGVHRRELHRQPRGGPSQAGCKKIKNIKLCFLL